MQACDIENAPHLCVQTLDGNAHVIPVEVITKIVSGEMGITEMDEWEMIARSVLSEWLGLLEAQAEYKATAKGAQ